MSSSRRAQRRRRHERHGKPSYPPGQKNGLAPRQIIVDEWTSTPHDEVADAVRGSDEVVQLIGRAGEEAVRNFRSRFFR